MTTKEMIKEYVDDHYNHFGFFPCDVVVNDKVYLYEEYMKILFPDIDPALYQREAN
tara:strand:- start:358 stop:525 length:168 start_codon:yes stop_codon:yes gene_type:complete